MRQPPGMPDSPSARPAALERAAASQSMQGSTLGRKAALLLALRSIEPFAALVPPLVPLPRTMAEGFLAAHPGAWRLDPAARLERFRRWFDAAGWADRVEAVCGPAPWIVRSSGDEDAPDQASAGVYDSRVCAGREELGSAVGAVVLGRPASWSEQRRLGAPGSISPIAAFVQTLVGRGQPGGGGPPEGERPLLSLPLLRQVRSHLERLHGALPGPEPGPALICEWVLERQPPVSLTTITERAPDGEVVGQAAAGFGLFAAQRGGGAESRLKWLPGLASPVHGGGRLAAVEDGCWRLVQVRRAAYCSGATATETLTPAGEAALAAAGLLAIDGAEALVTAPRLRASRFLIAGTLAAAWKLFAALDEAERAALGTVIVEEGSAEEHAGINFLGVGLGAGLGAGLMVVRLPLERVPEDGRSAVVDPVARRVWFSPDAALELELAAVDVAPAFCHHLPADPFLPLSEEEVRALPAPRLRRLVEALLAEHDGGHEETLAHAAAAVPSLAALMARRNLPLADRLEILASSVLPRELTRVLVAGRGRVSPSLVGVLVEAPGLLGEAFWRGVAAAEAAGGGPTAVVAYARSRLVAAGLVDLPWALGAEAVETLLAWPHDARPAPAIEERVVRAAERLDRVRPGLAVLALRSARDLGVALAALDLYETDERARLWRRFARVLESAGAEALDEVLDLPLMGTLPPDLLVAWMERAAAGPEATQRLLEPSRRAGRELRELATSDLASGAELVAAFADLAGRAAAERSDSTAGPLARALFVQVVDALDRAGKRRLAALMETGSPALLESYRSLLRSWLDLLAVVGVGAATLAPFAVWLAESPRSRLVEDLTLVARPWSAWVAEAEERGVVRLPNLHQLHNVLHQVSLWRVAPWRADQMPRRLAELLALANTFCNQPNRLLRWEPRLLEIERRMAIHKASFTFTPGMVSIWFVEPAAAPPELPRLAVFEALMPRFCEWWPEVGFRALRVRQEGDWSLRIEARSRPGHAVHESLRTAFLALVTLFDMASGLSRVPLSGDAGRRFRAPEWGPLFRELVAYRGDFEAGISSRDLEIHPLSKLLATLALDEALEAWLLDAWHRGLDDLAAELSALAAEEAPRPVSRWAARKARIDLLSLLLAARWPAEAFELLRGRRSPLPAGLGPLSRALLGRRCPVTGGTPSERSEGADRPPAAIRSVIGQEPSAMAATSPHDPVLTQEEFLVLDLLSRATGRGVAELWRMDAAGRLEIEPRLRPRLVEALAEVFDRELDAALAERELDLRTLVAVVAAVEPFG